MFTYARQNEILTYINEHRFATVGELCAVFYVSEATLRRDLAQLGKDGFVQRVRGGAAALEGGSQDQPFPLRSGSNREKKKRIAKLALPLIKNADTLFLDASTTTACLAENLAAFRDLTVVTNSLITLHALQDTSFKIICTGGKLVNRSALAGFHALETLRSYFADTVFLSCSSFGSDLILYEANEENAFLKREMLKNAKKKVLLCDSSKFDQRHFCKICPAQELDFIVTDQRPSEQLQAQLAERWIF